ncbi:hypothetical protein K1719_031356 [Acacia pycnantha]|nr:hypothetical protein K1719_031356 [Acacia pycnantha]
MQSGDAMSPTTSRDLPPCDETKVENKHHATNICAFYAKGWCIKGELVTQIWKREVQQEEGIGDDVKRSREPYI